MQARLACAAMRHQANDSCRREGIVQEAQYLGDVIGPRLWACPAAARLALRQHKCERLELEAWLQVM